MCSDIICYLCHGSNISFRPGKVRGGPDLKICECSDCKLVFLSSVSHISEGFYENSNMTTSSQIHGDKPMEIDDQIAYTQQDDERRFHTLKDQIKNKSILDFGCGVGGFVKRATDVADIVHGIELEERLFSNFHKEKLNVFKCLSDIPADLKKTGYEYITLFHVLEHITDPLKFLMELAEFLAQTGELIIEVPNSNDALLTLYENSAYSDFIYWNAHVFYYNTESLTQLLKKVGLSPNYTHQIQRYPLSNHLHWLSIGQPNGQNIWDFLNSDELNNAYANRLGYLNKCDTLLMSFSKNSKR
jgi:2-polyprenyl-3-methyl-5-hydroxy-6-metoxy-1,4-benzoquinol methylase